MFSMKRLIFVLFTIINLQAKVLLPIELDWSIYNDVEIEELLSKLSVEADEDVISEIQVAKLSLLNGEIDGAISLLSELLEKYPKSSFKLLTKRYLAISFFIIGDYDRTFNILSDPGFEETNNYRQICILKIASNLATNNLESLKISIDKCKRLNQDLSNNDYIWLDYMMIKLENKFNKIVFKDKINKIGRFEDNEYIRSWLKFSLLFNHTDLVTENLEKMPEMAFQNEILRTLLAINIYRSGNTKLSKDFIEDLNNSNAAYLKSLLSILDSEYKTAYAHLKASLKRRPYSIMANQLMTALAYQTKNYEDARLALTMLIPTKNLTREKKLIKTALLVQEENFNRAAYEIERVFHEYNKKMPFEGTILQNYIFFRVQNKEWIKTSADSCLNFDGVSCWLHAQSITWDEYDKKIEELEAKPFKVTQFIDEITEQKISNRLDEKVFISQKDITELDIQNDPYLEDMGEDETQP